MGRMGGEADIPPDNISFDGDTFVVLANDEGQYSIWPAGKIVPEGWSSVSPPASKAECRAFVDAQWTDMRPRSLADVTVATATKRPQEP
jgi:MbtH protein